MRSSVAPGVLADPGDDLVDDRRAFGLVVELVAESRVGPTLDVRQRGQDLRCLRRDEPVIEAVQDQRRQGQARSSRVGRGPLG